MPHGINRLGMQSFNALIDDVPETMKVSLLTTVQHRKMDGASVVNEKQYEHVNQPVLGEVRRLRGNR